MFGYVRSRIGSGISRDAGPRINSVVASQKKKFDDNITFDAFEIIGLNWTSLTFSDYNETRDERKNFARYTHLATYAGRSISGGGLRYLILHNVEGEISSDDLFGFCRETGSEVIEVFSPKDESVLRGYRL